MTANKIQIKSIDGEVRFEHECENNTHKITVLEAIINNADFSGANISGVKISLGNRTVKIN